MMNSLPLPCGGSNNTHAVAKVLDEKYETAAQSILDFRLKEFNPKSKI